MRYCFLRIQQTFALEIALRFAAYTIAIIYHRCCEKCVLLKRSDKQTSERIDQYIAANQFLLLHCRAIHCVPWAWHFRYVSIYKPLDLKCMLLNVSKLILTRNEMTHNALPFALVRFVPNVKHFYCLIFCFNAIVVAESFFHLIQFKWAQPAWIKPHEF